MVSKHLLTFEQIDVLVQAIAGGACWKQIQQEIFPQFTIIQLRNAFYKIKHTYPELFHIQNVEYHNSTKIISQGFNDYFALELF
ncbi:hypothetical protein SS50377_28094 [Spironucleus salmonicida]|uniref:Myb-like DNA-binding domain-containing protein n=1 Tax=Spironucleus salmonicida TaxID=348837 RepID=A0A9P8LKP7_9EUKA|nr:hypothetical protein SS50377_28094 [Spironucleus salmonicida]